MELIINTFDWPKVGYDRCFRLTDLITRLCKYVLFYVERTSLVKNLTIHSKDISVSVSVFKPNWLCRGVLVKHLLLICRLGVSFMQM